MVSSEGSKKRMAAALKSMPSPSLIQMLAGKRATAMSLRALFETASSQSLLSFGARRVSMAQFLHRELPIRMAQRIDELSRLPFGLAQSEDVRWITETYGTHVERLVNTKKPENANEEEAFARAVSEVLVNRVAVPRRLARAVRQTLVNSDERETVDDAIERFFVSRIGLRLLVEHYLTARAKDGAGEIDAFCKPGQVALETAKVAKDLCERDLGRSPNIDIVGDLDATFTYAPQHCRYVLLELLKNACRATSEFHSDGPLPPVKVVVVAGDEDFSIKVADLGGGCSRREAKLAWSWFHSKYPLPQNDQADGGTTNDPSLALTSGWGLGLPLSRAYTRYFGGDLRLRALQGYGCDSYIFLSRLGFACEKLPTRVQFSPAERDSTL